jgi:hypothetical protein
MSQGPPQADDPERPDRFQGLKIAGYALAVPGLLLCFLGDFLRHTHGLRIKGYGLLAGGAVLLVIGRELLDAASDRPEHRGE